jgi:hypothetical protein
MAYTFDGLTRTITLTSGTTTLEVPDLYSRWKDWVLISDNSKWPEAFSSVGGDPIDPGSGTSVPPYIFLQNDWKVRPQEANHTLNVIDGILLVEGGGDPFLNTLGSFVVRVNYQQPVQAITVATGGGGGLTQSQVAEAVWNATLASYNNPGSAGAAQNQIATLVTLANTLLKYQRNRTKVDQNAYTLTVYDDDGTTPIRIFDLRNFAGLPSLTEVAERIPT